MITLVAICTHLYLEKRNAYDMCWRYFTNCPPFRFQVRRSRGMCVRWVLKIWNRTLESRSPFPSILQMDGIRILEKQFQGSHGCTDRILKKILKKIIFVVRNQIFLQGPLQCSKNSNVTTGSGRAHALSEEKRRSWWRYVWTFCQSAVPWRCSPRIRPGSRFQPEHTKLSDTWPHGQAGQAGRERNVGP